MFCVFAGTTTSGWRPRAIAMSVWADIFSDEAGGMYEDGWPVCAWRLVVDSER